jgi:two-component system KDP operon response regulator KdpE
VQAARAAAGQSVADSAGAATAVAAATRTVVIAHPLPHVRAMIRVSLGDGPFEFREAEDGATAVELARVDPPDLVFFDWFLPDAPAGAICRRLRADGVASESQIVAIAPRLEGVDERALAAIGADALLEWPFSSLQLIHTVTELLGPNISPR